MKNKSVIQYGLKDHSKKIVSRDFFQEIEKKVKKKVIVLEEDDFLNKLSYVITS